MTTPRDTTTEPLDALIDELTSAGERRQFADGELLCREHDESGEAYVILDGAVEALVDGHAGPMTVAVHERGAIIGEVTTLIGGQRTATLAARGPTTVASLSRDVLHQVFEQHPDASESILRAARERTNRSRVAALLSDELQANDGAVVAAIADRVTWTSVSAGQTLFERGDPADAAYLVVSGRLGVTDFESDDRSGPDDDVVTSRVVEVGRGGIVGEFGLLEDRVRNATVVALRDSSLARLSARDFAALSGDHTSLAMGLVRRVLARSGSETAAAPSKRSFALAITADIDSTEHDDITTTMVDALEACGSTIHLTAGSIDRTLRSPGIADTRAGAFGEIRLAELLHQAETDSDHVVLDTGPGLRSGESPNWVDRAFHHADQIVIICSPDPDDDEAAVITRLLDTTPAGIPRWLAVRHPAECPRPSGAARLRDRFGVDEVHHLRGSSATDISRVARLAAGRGVGLVLSGGGARGHAHIGVYRALTERGIPIDRVVGTSMGSIVAGGIGQQVPPDELLRVTQQGADKLLDYTIPLVSLIKGERIVRVLDEQFDEWEMDDTWTPCACISTDLTTAEIVVHRDGPVARAIRTSIAIPGVLPPVARDGHLLADGGILDNLPAGVFGSDPSIGVIIASDVAPPEGPTAKGDHGLSVSGWTVMRSTMVPRSARRAERSVRRVLRREERPADTTRYPALATTLLRSLLIGSSRTRDDHLAAGIIDLHLELDLRQIPLLDFGMVVPAADGGHAQSCAALDPWLAERGGSPWGEPAPSTTVEPSAPATPSERGSR
ncbi:cyclic nucleotide-binding domain-containing protein [Ilumatobacter nonamiensis]|uniref:cyclic nucleotide-binding domain-containing protein n=1 Tax=Ilumatobacter nonamiensis TaxID=467093 RepID=UPI0003467888|nr:cyclic nucleotide-binding domain-containing protein [Ilumatobacter nonamiensis]